MKVLLVNKFHYHKGGAETYYFSLAEGLRALGHEVAFFSMRHPDNEPTCWSKYFVSEKDYVGKTSVFQQVREAATLVYSFEAKRKFEALLNEFKPDIVHLNNVHRQITLSILDAPYLKVQRVPVVYTAHDYILLCPAYTMLNGRGEVCDQCLDGHFKHALDNTCIKGSKAKSALAMMEAEFLKQHKSYSKIDLIVAPSEFMKSKLEEGGYHGRVVVLQNFADDAVISRAASSDENATDCERPYILFFGRLSAEKGVDVLLKAFERIRPLLPRGMRLVIVGDGPARTGLERLAASLSCFDSIEFTGYQTGDSLQRYVEAASLAVVGSRWRENMPYSIIEGFAAGTPVVGTNIGGIPELVTEGVTGFLCEPGDVDSMVKAIKRGIEAFRSPDVYARLQCACRDYVLTHCSRKQFMVRLVSYYEDLIHE